MGLMEAMLSTIYISWWAMGPFPAKTNSIPENTWNAATAKIALTTCLALLYSLALLSCTFALKQTTGFVRAALTQTTGFFRGADTGRDT